MRVWVAAGGLYFIYVALCAALVPRLAGRRRLLGASGALAGFGFCAVAHLQPDDPILHEWLLPPIILLLSYWTSGLLFVGPMLRVERALGGFDRLLRIDHLAATVPRWLAEVLELAYVGVYPLVPITLALHLFLGPDPNADRFWTVVLITDFICFGFLPWIQTRPPRALLAADPWNARMRALNLELLGHASIKVNTFPSGHAAEALAVTLLLLDLPWPVVVGVAVSAALVSAGAAFGRYHYAADVVAGWVVAAWVWILLN